jgi:RNA polymerase sigma factor (sigma-70 family)
VTETDVVETLARRYWWPGADVDDVRQEAWFALERCRPKWRAGAGRTFLTWAWLCVENHLRDLTLRECSRRPRFAELHDAHPSFEDVVERVENRRLLRLCLELPLGPKERRALNGVLVGEELGVADRTGHMARYRARRKLLAAA